ncbi:MAG: AAA family ATPase [Pirellulaceae bacterium]|nr:AAA family ATPase [Pirellulaceae bacterium]
MTACFGYPLSYEDAPRRAVHAASQIQSHVAEIESDIQSRLNLQIQVWQSIHSGMVVASGADDRRLVGDVLSLVARMDRDIEPGQITITQDSFRLVEHSFVCEELAATCGLPGQAPQTLYRVIEKVRDTEEFSSNESVEYTPLVGRDQEVSMLMNRWELTGEGFGQLVALIGDAGMGKSRLVHVLTQHVSQTSPSVSPPIIEWSCSPYQSSTAFHPAIGALQRRLQFTRQQSDDQKRNALKTLLDSLGFDLAVAMPIFCDLLSLPVGSEYPPLNLSSPKQKELTLELLHQWICAEAQQRPTLFIVEDLHWVDPSTLDFLQSIANNPISAPYLCLLTFRPDFSTPWTSRAHQTQIALNRLTRSQVSQLIASKVDNDAIPLGLIDRIADRTDGVPLFVEEYAKMLNDSADLMSDTAELSHDSTMGSQSSSIPIPATLQGLLTARLDRIGGDENVVRMAAALGREFSFSMIAAAMDLGASVLANELEKLVESQLLFRRGTPPDSQYTFKHALIQDAAYDSMLRGQRKEIHQKIAAAMETEFPEIRVDQPELLAHHYSEAGDHFNAAPLWETAGSISTQRGALVEAIQHLNKGMASLKSLSESPERDELEYRINVPLGIATLSLKGYAAHELGTIYQRRMELCQKLGDKMGQLHAHWAMGSWRIVRDEVETCLDIASQIMPMAREMDDDGALMEALFIQAIAQFYHGDFSDSLASCQQGWDLFDAERCLFHTSRTGQHAGVAHLSYMALNHWYLGQPASALQRMRQAVQLAESLNHPFSVAFALHHDGWLNAAMQLGTDAVQSAVRHMQVAREQAFFFWETTGLLHHAGGLICLDDSAQARDELLQGLAQYDATGAQLALPRYYGYQADALTRRGDFDAASESLELAKAAVDKCDERFHEPEVWRLCAQWASAQGNQDQAAEFAAKSLDVANHLGSLAWRLTALVDLCQYTPPGSGRDRFVQQVSIAVAEFEPCEVDIPIVSRARSLCPPSSI